MCPLWSSERRENPQLSNYAAHTGWADKSGLDIEWAARAKRSLEDDFIVLELNAAGEDGVM